MTINEAIKTAIVNLEEVRLPLRDQENIAKITNSLGLMYSIAKWADENVKETAPEEKEEKETEG